MKLSNLKITSKGLYWGLIVTFALLYVCVGFVSTLHSITFFHLANSMTLAVLLGLTYEIGQASVLFSILMTKNKEKFLPWALMILLTALQVTANVYASFRFMAQSGNNDWQYWQKAILLGVQASAEQYQVIISWISGALLPIVALGMTALVAQNIKLMSSDDDEKPKDEIKETSPQVTGINPDSIKNELMPVVESAPTTAEHKEEPVPKEEPIPAENSVTIPVNNDFEKDFILKETPENSKPKKSKVKLNSKEIPVKSVKSKETKLKTQKDKPPVETTSKSKKVKESLPKEDVQVPEKPKRTRTVDPLKKKEKIKKLTFEELHKPDLISLIENQDKVDVIDSNGKEKESEENASNVLNNENNSQYLENGVEVIDAKAITKKERNKDNRVDKFGIPIKQSERRNFDHL
jgi:hypothetical protein